MHNQRHAAVLLASMICAGCLFERIDNPHQYRDCLPPRADEPATVIPQWDGITAGDGMRERLRKRVEFLAGASGGRSYRTPERLARAAAYIHREFQEVRAGTVAVKPYRLANLSKRTRRKMAHRAKSRGCWPDWSSRVGQMQELDFQNIELTIEGSAKGAAEMVVIGAHYDSDACESGGCNPGADDNASGVAALIELADRVAAAKPERTVRFVAFTNEEEPFFHTRAMGSWQYAHAAKHEGDRISAMLSIETIGYYRDEAGSQDVPWFGFLLGDLPDTGNSIAFVGDRHNRPLVRQALCAFQRNTRFPAEGISALGWLPGINWSDHWAFTQHGYPAVMVTDTAPSRNHCYHRACDTPDRLDYDHMARVVEGLKEVILSLAQVKEVTCDAR